MDPIIISIITLIFCAIALSWFAGSDAPYVPTKTELILKPLKLAKTAKGKIFYELGSGDGRVVFEAAKLGANSFGVEQSWIRVWLSRLKARQLNLPNANFFHGNIFARNYFPADVVYIYMLQPCIDRLESKLKKELKKGSILITQTYHFKHVKPFQKTNNFNLYRI